MRNRILAAIALFAIMSIASLAQAGTYAPPQFTCGPWSTIVDVKPPLKSEGGVGMRPQDCVWVRASCPAGFAHPYQGSRSGTPRLWHPTCIPLPHHLHGGRKYEAPHKRKYY